MIGMILSGKVIKGCICHTICLHSDWLFYQSMKHRKRMFIVFGHVTSIS